MYYLSENTNLVKKMKSRLRTLFFCSVSKLFLSRILFIIKFSLNSTLSFFLFKKKESDEFLIFVITQDKIGVVNEPGVGFSECITYLLNALVSLTFLLCLEGVVVGLSGGEVLALIFWLTLSVLAAGLGKTGGGNAGVGLLGAVGVLIFGGN